MSQDVNLGGLFSRPNIANTNIAQQGNNEPEEIFEDFSSVMQNSYNFKQDDARLVFDILDTMNATEIDEDAYNRAIELFRE